MGLIIWLSVWALLSFCISRKVKSTITTIGGGFIGSLLILIFFYGINGAFFTVPETVDACGIAEAFANDEMSAIAKYDGKTLIVRGVAGSKGDTLMDYFYSSLAENFGLLFNAFFKDQKPLTLQKFRPGRLFRSKGSAKQKHWVF